MSGEQTIREHLEAIRDACRYQTSAQYQHAVAALNLLDEAERPEREIEPGITLASHYVLVLDRERHAYDPGADPLPRVSSVPAAPHATKETT